MLRVLVLLLFALSGSAAEVRVLAAASLTDVLQEIARDYERRSGDRIVFSFAASSVLARQIEAGAPADLFLSADQARMDGLQRRALIDPRTRVSVLSNALVVVVPLQDRRALRSARDLLSFASLAMAEPATVPAGIYAREYLQKQGLWNALRPRIVPTENVRGALRAVASGNVDAAIVYRTDAATSKRVRVAFAVPRHAGPRISYPFAVLRDAPQPVAARRFLAHLRGPAARAVFARFGFDVLP